MSTSLIKTSILGLAILIPLFLLTSACNALEVIKSVDARSEKNSVSILDHKGIESLKKILSLVITDRAPESRITQHFFVADYKKGSDFTYMLWKEARKLWIMPLGDESEESWLGVRYPSGGQFIDLDKDVVPTDKEVGTSTYLVSQAWVVQRVYEAVINGKLIEIEPK